MSITTKLPGLPYKEITKVANRDIIRANTTRGRETYFIDFADLKIRSGFNLRKEYVEIPEFAEFIRENGLPAPLVVDMLENGTCFIEQGHRRYKALELLKKEIDTMDLPGVKFGRIECFINARETDELTRLIRQYSSNNGEKFTPLELGELCTRLFTVFHYTQVDIAKQLGISRQNVKNMMILAEQPGHIKEAIKSKTITPTAAIGLSRKIKDSDTRNGIIQEAVAKGTKVSTSDVKRIIGDKKEDWEKIEAEVDEITGVTAPGEKPIPIVPALSLAKEKSKFDTSRAEIGLCNRVIKNADKINQLVEGLPNEQLRQDINLMVGFIQNDMEDIREYVHKNKKQ